MDCPTPPNVPSAPGAAWTLEKSNELQEAIDGIFSEDSDDLKDLKFSFTIADPSLEDCPLIGCSTGFHDLCGYTMHEIVGRNCRFLVDPVPDDYVNINVKRWSRLYCNAVREGKTFTIPENEREGWMPTGRMLDDGIFCIQTNARKDGTLFRNMFYLKDVDLDGKPYIIGLQTEMPSNHEDISDEDKGVFTVCHAACRRLDSRMGQVERILSRMFWVSSAMRRQDSTDPDDGFENIDGQWPKKGADTFGGRVSQADKATSCCLL